MMLAIKVSTHHYCWACFNKLYFWLLLFSVLSERVYACDQPKSHCRSFSRSLTHSPVLSFVQTLLYAVAQHTQSWYNILVTWYSSGELNRSILKYAITPTFHHHIRSRSSIKYFSMRTREIGTKPLARYTKTDTIIYYSMEKHYSRCSRSMDILV